MKVYPSLTCVSITAMLLAACVSTEVKPANPKVASKLAAVKQRHLATMVIYRPRNSFGGWVGATVNLDGKALVTLGNGRVFVFAIPPGHHVVEMDNKKSGTEVNLKADNSVYLKIEMVPGTFHGSGKLTQVAQEQGDFEAKRLELGSPTDIDNPSFR